MNLPQSSSRPQAGRVLGALVLVYILNFVDRSILGILVPGIRLDLHLTDTQLGLLGGTAFAIFYTTLGIPAGIIADRFPRVRLVAVALALWSLFTALTGCAQNFPQLFLARIGVGIGEAGGVAPSYSLIADYFAPGRRARAMSLYAFGSPIGSAGGLLFGGLLASHVSWRIPLLLVGTAGLVLSPAVRRWVPEPQRGGLDRVTTPAPATSHLKLFRKPTFWGLALGGALCSIPGYGLIFWLPSFLVRSYHLSLVQTSCSLAALTLVGGLLGLWSGGWLVDRLAVTGRAAHARIPALASLLCIPFYAIVVLGSATPWRLALLLPPTALALAWLGPVTSAVQQLVRAEQRAFASASFLFIINLIGLGGGSLLVGHLSDAFAARFADDSLRYAILAVLGFYVPAAALFLLAARHLERDWQT